MNANPDVRLPAVSVIMPVLNEERHLRGAVQAILAQEYAGEMEVVIALGPSTDRTDEIAAELVAEDPRVHTVPNPTGRTPAALNAAIKASRHPIVVRVEAQVGMKHLTGSTLEVSGGGMSLRYTGEVQNGDDISVTFDLPHRPGIKVRGIVCWLKPSESLAGIRFDPPEQPGRDLVRAWIDQYLEIE